METQDPQIGYKMEMKEMHRFCAGSKWNFYFKEQNYIFLSQHYMIERSGELIGVHWQAFKNEVIYIYIERENRSSI